MRQRAQALLLVIGIVALPSASFAQVLGSIAGNVKDGSGAVLPGVTVEAASPALIEKVRTAVTDGSGQYRIINLPPGTYSVSFSLTGFSTVKREGVEVSPSFTSNIDGELKVGAVQETITVTGESPIVDIQSSAQTRTMTDQAFKELPSGGSWIQMAALVPAIRASNTDVGGVLGDQVGAQVDAHGSRPQDGVSMIDGLRLSMFETSGFLLGVNYGWNKVRFPAPVPAGSKVRATAEVVEVEEVGGGWWQIVTRFTVEVEGSEKPCCVADSVGRALAA